MVNHVKLEIAVQLIAEKIADIYNKIESTEDKNLKLSYEKELNEAFDEKEKIETGNIESINKILNERGEK